MKLGIIITIIMFFFVMGPSFAGQQPLGYEKNQPVDNGAGPVGASERLLRSVTSRSLNAVVQSADFARRYPAVTTACVVSGTLLVPQCRHFVCKHGKSVVCKICAGLGALLWADNSKKIDGKLEETIRKLSSHSDALNQLKALAHQSKTEQTYLGKKLHATYEGVTQVNEDVKRVEQKVDKSSDQMQILFARIDECIEMSKKINRGLAELVANSQRLESKFDQGYSKLGQTVEHAHGDLACKLQEQAASSQRLEHKVDQGYTRLDQTVQQAHGDLAQKMDRLSTEQKEMFQQYAQQFNGRFDSLAELISRAATAQQDHAATCSQAYARKGLVY